MKSQIICALAFSILVIFLILFIPLFIIYQHLQELNSMDEHMDEDAFDKSYDFISDSCPSFQFPCQSLAEPSSNESLENPIPVICIDRQFHCDSKIDCPNGEDEEKCDDISKIVVDYYQMVQERFKTTPMNPLLGMSSEEMGGPPTPFDTSWTSPPDWTQFESQTEKNGASEFLDIESVSRELRCWTGDVSCCDYDHEYSVICKNQSLTAIPPALKSSIKTLNLDHNLIPSIESVDTFNYSELLVLSLRENLITFIRARVFVHLTKLKRLYLRGNAISYIDKEAFVGLDNLQKVYLSYNRIHYLELSMFTQTPSLQLLDLSNNHLELRQNQSFPPLENLQWLDCGENEITAIDRPFDHLTSLTILTLGSNKIREINEESFSCNKQLVELDLGYNQLKAVQSKTFHNLRSLSELYLNDNPITWLPIDIFWSLKSLKSLNLTGGVTIKNIDTRMFSQNKRLTHLYFSKFRYCMFAPKVRVCRPYSDGLSSRDHLLSHPILKRSVWLVATFTCVGNILVIIWRSVTSKEDQVLSLFVQNLSVADFLMGVYLLTIGSYDLVYEDKYAHHALKWTSSWQCTFCGALAMLSSELSVLVLTLITIERYRCITSNLRVVTASSAKLNLLVVWSLAIIISIYPIFWWSSSNLVNLSSSSPSSTLQTNGSNDFGDLYYGSSGLCFPLHIDDPFVPGWQYSSLVFIGINFNAVIVIVTLYYKMFSSIKSDRKYSRPALPGDEKKREDAILAFRFCAIVLTDCLCWLPIVAIKILAFTNFTISPTINAWLVVFVLPINSALNPVIYTLAAPTDMHRKLYKQCRTFLNGCKQNFLYQSFRSSTSSNSVLKTITERCPAHSISNASELVASVTCNSHQERLNSRRLTFTSSNASNNGCKTSLDSSFQSQAFIV